MATASAGRATRVRRRLPRVPRALAARRSRGLEAGQGRRQAHGQTAQLLRPNARSGYDPTRPRNRGITREGALRCGAGANTAVCWRLDQKESTKLSLKYRRGKGEILIVSHAGRGWWDPTSDAKGDVFRLVQRLEPGLSFGNVRKRLRAFAGLSPCFPSADRAGGRKEPDRAVAARWSERKAVWSNSPTWRYLRRQRGLSAAIIEAASVAGVLREGPVGSAWFAHFDRAGAVAHVDVRGPTYKGSLTGA